MEYRNDKPYLSVLLPDNIYEKKLLKSSFIFNDNRYFRNGNKTKIRMPKNDKYMNNIFLLLFIIISLM